MAKEIIYSGQSYLDKVIECTGDIDNAYQMSLLNNINLMDRLTVGNSIIKAEVTNWDVVDFFDDNNRPATHNTNNGTVENLNEFILPGLLPYSL